tara:strand:- start:48 stop:665 length:618 start_codon:yes stop_codon:yes gene_type:complete
MKVTNPQIYNFQGHPILHFNSKFKLNGDEEKSINNLEWIENVNNYKTKHNFILNKKEFSRVKQMFDNSLDYYIKEVLGLGNKVDLKNSWATLNKQNQQHHEHCHKNVLFSINYYPQVEDGGICFTFRRSILEKGYNFEYNVIENNKFNSSRNIVNLKDGDVVIFPAWLFHESTPNTSNKERYMFGANYFIKGEIGNEVMVDLLTL